MRDEVNEEEVRLLFQKKLKPRLKKLTAERKLLLVKLSLYSAASSGLIIYFSHFYFHIDPSLTFLSLALVLGFGFVGFTNNYFGKFKKQAMQEIFEVLIPSSSYYPDRNLSSEVFMKSNLYSGFNNYFGEDLVVCKMGMGDMSFCQLDVEQESESEKDKKTVSVFKGMFFVFELPVDLNQRTLILNNRGARSRQDLELINLENEDLVECYRVYSDNPNLSEQLFKPMVLENLIAFNRKYDKTLDLSVQGNQVYIAVGSDQNHFEARLFGEVISFKAISEIYDIVQLVRDLSEDFNVKSDAA